MCPGLTKPDMAETDTCPREQGAEAADGEKPVEDDAVDLCICEKREQTDDCGKDNGHQRPTLSINIGKDARGV